MSKKPAIAVVPPPPPPSLNADDWVRSGSAPTTEPAAPAADDRTEAVTDSGDAGRLNVRIGADVKRRLMHWCIDNGKKPAAIVSMLITRFLDEKA